MTISTGRSTNTEQFWFHFLGPVGNQGMVQACGAMKKLGTKMANVLTTLITPIIVVMEIVKIAVKDIEI